MKTIATFPDLAGAEVARAALEAEGIPASIPDSHLAGLDWRLGTALGGVRLQVATEHVEAADVFLAQNLSGELAEIEEFTERSTDGPRCPACGSSSVARDPLVRRAKALALLFLPFLLLVLPFLAAARRRLRCEACGHTWRAVR